MLGLDMDEWLAFSTNVGHKNLSTTLNYYGRPDDNRRKALLAELPLRKMRVETGQAEFLATLIRTRPKAGAKVLATLAEND